jgi:hypothetical protein
MSSLFKAPIVIGRFAFVLFFTVAPIQARPWSDGKGGTVEAEYVNSTADMVTIRRTADGQAFRLKLSELSEEDRAFVLQKQAEAKAANMVEAKLVGEVAWRRPAWKSRSWQTTQPVEIWLWDEKTRAATEKISDAKANYHRSGNRNEFYGTFRTEAPVKFPKGTKFVVKAKFQATVNGRSKDMEETSQPMTPPAPTAKGEVNLPTVRLSITR